jgi:hypothetical protein
MGVGDYSHKRYRPLCGQTRERILTPMLEASVSALGSYADRWALAAVTSGEA